MEQLNKFVRRRFLAVAVVLGCCVVAGLGFWRARASPETNTPQPQAQSRTGQKHDLYERIRNGVGTEVRFSIANGSDDEIKASIDSLAQFIKARANLRMSDETRDSLQIAEKETLTGKRPRIRLDDLTSSFTRITADKLATLTDEDIERGTNRFQATSDGQISPRMSGKWGLLKQEELATEIKVARDRKRQGDSSVEKSLRPFVEEEINDRIANLSQAIPDKFGRVREEGVTPIQAVLIAYSVAADDALADSHTQLAEKVVDERTKLRLTRAEAREQRRDSKTAFGRNGFFHSSPLGLFFNKTTMHELLSGEGGRK